MAPGHQIGSAIGYILAIAGAGLVVLDRRLHWQTGQQYVLTESLQVPFIALGTGLFIVGIILFLLFKWVPTKAKEQWPAMNQDQAREQTMLNEIVLSTGTVLIPGGLLASALVYQLDADRISSALAVSWAASAMGLGMFLWGAGRKGLLRRLLAKAETTPKTKAVETADAPTDSNATAGDANAEPGETPAPPNPAKPDPRIAIVLPALDKLLETVTDEALEGFKGTEAAKLYLQMLSELGE